MEFDTPTARALYKLLPTGDGWAGYREDTDLKKLIQGIALQIDELTTDTEIMVAEYYPDQIGNFLSDWIEILQLPKCGQLPDTLQQRLQQVIAMFRISPYSNAQFFMDIADVFGYTITIAPHDPLDPFKIAIVVDTVEEIYFTCGGSSAGDALVDTVSSGDQELLCILSFYKPAHTYIDYTPIP